MATDLGFVAGEPGLVMDPAASFEPHRRRLLGLGVSPCSVRSPKLKTLCRTSTFAGTPSIGTAVADSRAFLTTASRREICLDVLRSARVRREEYVGPWLPEPVVDTGALAPDASTELAEDLSIALLLALDRLSPLERAAFLLHDVFDCSFQ